METLIDLNIPQVVTITKKQQVIAVLSALSNCNQMMYADTEFDLQQNAINRIKTALKDPILTSFIGNWELVWGPCLHNSLVKNKKSEHFNRWLSDNAMYIVKSQDPENSSKMVYVVAVAGANSVSDFGWRDEDSKVGRMVNWEGVTNARISQGCSESLNLLLKMKDNKKNILDFFNTILVNDTIEVATCGHSLGGALAPLVALKLIEMKESNGFSNGIVSCYPSAGPTAGNAELASYAEEKLANNYHSVINNYDIVPHGWETKMVNRIPKLYSNSAYGNLTLIGVPLGLLNYKYEIIKLIEANYTRIFGRTVNEYAFDGKPKGPKEPPVDMPVKGISKENNLFFCQAAYQHTTVYNKANAFNLPETVSNQILRYIKE
jgi:hypothetical protein